jgi:hypothetical protein
MKVKLYNHKMWKPVYDGDEGNAPQGDAEPQPQADPAPQGDSGGDNKSFSQEELNKILAAERRKHQATANKAIEEAQALRARAQLTQQERGELDERLEQLKSELLTKEQQAKRNADRLKQKHQDEISSLTSERDTWQKRYTSATIERAIIDAAAENNAFRPQQIVAILGSDTRLVEALDDEGNATGNLSPKVRFADKDKEGKPVILELSPSDAVKRMKEMDDYLNLFKGEGTSGVGLRSHPSGRKPDVATLARDPAAYRAARKKGQIF